MIAPEPDSVVWHTNSYSVGNGACVEVAPADRVLVRGSKDLDGPALAVPTSLASLPQHTVTH